MLPAIKKAIHRVGNDLVELSTNNESLKNKIESNDEKWLEESEIRLWKQFNDDKRANLIMSRMQKQIIKH